MVLALFDFDGTLTHADSFPAFLRFLKGKSGYWLALAKSLPVVLAWKAGGASNQQAKEALLSAACKGWTQQALESAGARFANQALDSLLRPQAKKLIQTHLNLGHSCCLVTASPDAWMKPIAKALEIPLISSQLEYQNQKFTGKLMGANCYGPEKAKRIKATYDLTQYDSIYAYGDSRGDLEMLSLASHPHYKTLILPDS